MRLNITEMVWIKHFVVLFERISFIIQITLPLNGPQMNQKRTKNGPNPKSFISSIILIWPQFRNIWTVFDVHLCRRIFGELNVRRWPETTLDQFWWFWIKNHSWKFIEIHWNQWNVDFDRIKFCIGQAKLNNSILSYLNLVNFGTPTHFNAHTKFSKRFWE